MSLSFHAFPFLILPPPHNHSHSTIGIPSMLRNHTLIKCTWNIYENWPLAQKVKESVQDRFCSVLLLICIILMSFLVALKYLLLFLAFFFLLFHSTYIYILLKYSWLNISGTHSVIHIHMYYFSAYFPLQIITRYRL